MAVEMTMGITIIIMETGLEMTIIIMPDVEATMKITHGEEHQVMLQADENI